MLPTAIRRMIHPNAYNGIAARSGYFEGWYCKLISADHSRVLAVIVGAARDGNRDDAHAFFQLIDSVSGKSYYVRYPAEQFSADKRTFDVHLGANRFSLRGMSLDIQNNDISIFGQLSFHDTVPYHKHSIMGPFLYLPGMECYHGVLSIRHCITGTLVYNGVSIVFNGGRGYIEKDSGVSFPAAWIWMQANEFENESASFMFSVADIPFLGTRFAGILCFLQVNGCFHSFTTYSGVNITEHSLGERISLTLEQRHSRLRIQATSAQSSVLIAPGKGKMTRSITESVTSQIEVWLDEARNGFSHHGCSKNASLEIAGDVSALLNKATRVRKEELQ